MSKRLSRRGRSAAAPRRWPLGLFLLLLLLLAAGGTGYVLWLDQQVVSQFEGKRWALPARVYARPLELYEGMQLRPEILLAELEALNYRQEAGDRPGSYRRYGNAFRITT